MTLNQADYEREIGIVLPDFEVKWSTEDQKLRDWILSCPLDVVLGLLDILKTRLNNDLCTDKYFELIEPRYPNALDSIDRKFAASILVNELREYSGRTLISSVPYENTLTKVHKRIGKHFKKSVPEVASISFREEGITLIMLGEALNELSVEELRSAISGMDLDRELTAEKLKPILTRTMSEGGIAAVAQLLGKNVIKKVIMAIVEKYILKKTGEKATKEILKRLGEQVAAQTLKRAMFWVGIALIIKDIWDISGEAIRVTTPLVSGIAIGRTLGRYGGTSA